MHSTRRTLFALLAAAGRLPAAREPRFEQVDLFHQGDAGVHTYRIPALVETRKGTLLAVVDARHENTSDLPGRLSLVIRRSFDGGRSWSPVKTLRAVNEGGVGDASLLLDRRTGRLWCFHAFGPPGIGFPTALPGARTGPSTLQWHAFHSDDDGASWSEPRDLTPQVKDPAWQAMFATSGTHYQTSRGRFLVPLVVRDAQRALSARNAYSDDGGVTWKVGAAIGVDTDESRAVETADGTILQNMRKKGGARAVARSSDGGVHFGAAEQETALMDPDCNAGLARYRHGGNDLLVFTNAASSQRRENLTVKISRDSGRTWSSGRTIHSGPAGYSTVIPLRDGRIAVLYERGDAHPAERITFARFDLEWATAVRTGA